MDAGGGGGVWYTFTLTDNEDRITSLQVTDQTFDAVLSVYSSSSTNDCEDLTCLFGTFGSRFSDQGITMTALAGTTYYVLVSGRDDIGDAGTFQLTVEVSEINRERERERRDIKAT